MIKTKNLVPEVYYNQSRDFQFLGRAFEIIFNYAKMNTDLITGAPTSNNLDDRLIPLLAKTVGFETRHQYNAQDLKNVCDVFIDLVRNKGTKNAIERAVYTLMNAQNISGYTEVRIDSDNHVVNIYIPYGLKDLVLLEDIFDYILPVGFDYRFIYGASNDALKNSISMRDTLTTFNVKEGLVGRIAKPQFNVKRPDDSTIDKEKVETTTGFAQTYTSKIASGNQIKPYEEDEGE